MDLEKLFQIQKALDEHIEREHPRQDSEDRLAKKILALQVELGECANEWCGFKFWKVNPVARTRVEHLCPTCDGSGELRYNDQDICDCDECNGTGKLGESNPLLEEYVDCLHFILSIGLELGYNYPLSTGWESRTITIQFNDLFHAVATLQESIECEWDEEEQQENFFNLMSGFIGLGQMLGFSWEEVEQAYFAKNAVNHERQNNGY